MTTPTLALNGKFLAAAPTAVHLVARQLGRALAREVLRIGAAPLDCLMPPDARADAELACRRVGRLRGIAWEQISLPQAARGRLLLNLCNMTPLVSTNALTMVHDAQVFTTQASYTPSRAAWARLNARTAGHRQPGVLTVSEAAKADLVACGVAPAEQIHVIPNGVDHVLRVRSEPGALSRLGVSSGGYALALANTMPHKNIGILLRAFAGGGIEGVKLVLTGQATAHDFAAAGHPVPDNVVFAGYVSDGEMRSLQENALAVCTPSLTEGFGMPPVEGMLLGTPAVIAPCGALSEVCGPSALRADPHDPAAWVAAIGRLRDEPAFRRATSDAGHRHAAGFTWAAAAAKVLAVIGESDLTIRSDASAAPQEPRTSG